MKVDCCIPGGFQTKPEIYEDGWAITLVMSDEEVFNLLGVYDPASGTSPSASVSREIARPIAEALRQKALGVV